MADLPTALTELASANSVSAVQTIADSLSATAVNPGVGAVLYSGSVGSASAHSIAVSMSQQNGLNIIDNTARAQFLSNPAVRTALTTIIEEANPTATSAEVTDLVDAALFDGPTSLWGQASSGFVSSLKGAITIVATSAANTEGVLATTEIPSILQNSSITAINGLSTASLPSTSSALLTSAESSFVSAVSKGGVFSQTVSGTTTSFVSTETLAALSLSQNGASSAATYTAEGFIQSLVPSLETTAATEAEGILASAGSKALGLLGLATGYLGNALIILLASSKPLNVGEDQYLAQLAAQPLDTPDASVNQAVTTDANGVTTVNVPLVSSDGSTNDKLIISENPNTNSVVLAVSTNNDSTLFVTSDTNGVMVSDDQITDDLPNQAYNDQIALGTDSSGNLDVNVTVDPGDTAIVNSDTLLADVSQEFTFSGPNETLVLPDISFGQSGTFSFPGIIYGFIPGDTIENVPFNLYFGSLSVSGNILTVTEFPINNFLGSTTTIELDPNENYSTDNLTLVPEPESGSINGLSGVNSVGMIVVTKQDANSVTDPSPTSQGNNNWYYGYETVVGNSFTYDVNSFVQFDENGGVQDGSGNDPYIRQGNMGAGFVGAQEALPVERWISDYTGLIDISGAYGGNGGGEFYIYVDGVEKFGVQAGPAVLDYEIVVPVRSGSKLDLIGTSNAPDYYSARFTAYISDIIACYAKGTCILKEDEYYNVENLKVGDLVCTVEHKLHPIKWLGHRHVDCRRHTHPEKVWPIRVAAHAFADAQPARDLFLSPDHAVFIDGVLIPIKELINGTTIVQEPRDQVTYYHVELEQHDVILAEGLPCESFLDTGNRASFANGGAVTALHPEFTALSWEMACAPLVIHGPQLAAVRSCLLERALDLGHAVAPGQIAA